MFGVRLPLICLLVVSVIAVGGCGGESEGSSGSGSIGKAEYIQRANALCRRERADLGKEIATFERLHAGSNSRVRLDLVHSVWLPTLELELFKLEHLEMPPPDRVQLETMQDAKRYSIDVVAIDESVPSIAVARRRFGRPDRLFREYDLDACASGPKQP